MQSARRSFGLVLALLPLVAFACSQPGERPASSGGSAPAAAGADAARPAGRFAGRDVTVGDVDEWIKEKLFENATSNRNPSRLFEIRKRALEQMAAEQALETAAAKEGKDGKALLSEELKKRSTVSDEEVEAFYDQHQDRYQGRTFEQLAPSIRRQLEQQKAQKAAQEYMNELRASTGFESTLEAPRFDIPGDGHKRGPDDAPIKLVEFSDYQCPFCKGAEAVVHQVLERYPTQVQLVYRHFPLDNLHPDARAAAEAAECAADQGKFWEFHDLLFQDAPNFREGHFGRYAAQLGLDRAAFDACVSDQRHAEKVKADIDAGQKIGITGTPAFYVDGRPVANARSLDQFAAVIDEELEKKGLPAPPPLPPQTAEVPMPGAAATPGGTPMPTPPAAAPGAPPAPGAPAMPPAPGAAKLAPAAPPGAAAPAPGGPAAAAPAPAPKAPAAQAP